ncbi:MAG: hypothetical protein ACTH8C_21925 [Pseudomonas taetrolens]|uniref:hypothetical protein n=1 Tax=Pseudomonas taetrolens TaxID=47884 RepID=UPI003F9AAE25
MNSIAQRALDRARDIPASEVTAPVQAALALPEIVISGPINRVMQLEGQRFAVDVVKSLGSSISNPLVITSTIRNLTATATASPSSYASGIKQVTDLLRDAL